MKHERRVELQRVAEGWTGLGVLLSPLPYVGECISDFCHRRAGKYYAKAFGPLSDTTLMRIHLILEGFMEVEHG